MVAASRRERERAARRETILAAAEALVQETGYWEMSMGDVARRAELSKGALYHYFENKDALCAAIAARSMSELLPRLEAASSSERTGLGQIRRLLEAYAEWFDGQPAMFRFAISWNVPGQSLDPNTDSFAEYREKVGEVTALGIDAVRRGQQDGSIRPELDPHLLNIQMWTSLLGVFMAHVAGDDFTARLPFAIDLDHLVPLHIAQSMRAIAGPNAELP